MERESSRFKTLRKKTTSSAVTPTLRSRARTSRCGRGLCGPRPLRVVRCCRVFGWTLLACRAASIETRWVQCLVRQASEASRKAAFQRSGSCGRALELEALGKERKPSAVFEVEKEQLSKSRKSSVRDRQAKVVFSSRFGSAFTATAARGSSIRAENDRRCVSSFRPRTRLEGSQFDGSSSRCTPVRTPLLPSNCGCTAARCVFVFSFCQLVCLAENSCTESTGREKSLSALKAEPVRQRRRHGDFRQPA